MPGRKVGAVAVLAAGALTIAVVVAKMQEERPLDRRYQPVGWGSEATLETRDDSRGGILFSPGIRFIEPPAGAERVDAYRLDLQSLDLTPTTRDAWMGAPGVVVQCDRAGLALGSAVAVVAGQLRVSGKAVSMRGEVRHARLSPN